MHSLAVLAVGAAAFGAASPIGSAAESHNSPRSTSSTSGLYETLKDLPELSTFVGYIDQSGLSCEVDTANNVTVFAPSNDAYSYYFEKDPVDFYGADLNKTNILADTLRYHVVQGLYQSSAVPEEPGAFLRTWMEDAVVSYITGPQPVNAVRNGQCVDVYYAEKKKASVIKADIFFDKGVIHIIDRMMFYPQPIVRTCHDTNKDATANALDACGLHHVFDHTIDTTFFAPSAEAMQAAAPILSGKSNETIKRILSYHYIVDNILYSDRITNGVQLPTLEGQNLTITTQGNEVRVGDAKIIEANVLTKNGVMHVIDKLLIPLEHEPHPGDFEVSTLPAPPPPTQYYSTSLASHGNFSHGQGCPSTRDGLGGQSANNSSPKAPAGEPTHSLPVDSDSDHGYSR